MQGVGSDDETLDPRAARRLDPRRASEIDLVLEILFHPDLSRVGDRAVLGAADDPALAAEIVVGRHAPAFRSSSGVERPLDDPCLSRKQLSLRFVAALSRVALDVDPAARRPVHVLDEAGRSLGAPPIDVRPGSILALGDRVLLLVALQRREPEGDMALLGTSTRMVGLRERIRQVAALDGTVLVRGPIGAGKELVARAVHGASRRRGAAFVAVNCAALPDALLESELFGHARGAFSGAVASHAGVFEAARGGTLMLDEIAELSPSAQAKLLRALELRVIRPVGAAVETPIDVRIVAATSREVLEELEAGRMRRDLYSRLDELVVEVPALSERRTDVPLLFTTFLRRLAETPDGAGLLRWFEPADDGPPPVPSWFFLELLAREFRHNVREVEHLAAHIASLNLAGGDFVPAKLDRLHEAPEREAGDSEAGEASARPDAERLAALLAGHDFVQGRVARALGVSHSTVDRWMREHAIARAQDLDARQVREALERCGGDSAEAARRLRVSERGLALRMRELGLSGRV